MKYIDKIKATTKIVPHVSMGWILSELIDTFYGGNEIPQNEWEEFLIHNYPSFSEVLYFSVDRMDGIVSEYVSAILKESGYKTGDVVYLDYHI